MKHTTKLMVISAILLALLAACGQAPVQDETKNVTDTAAKIADFELPAGFTPEIGAHMLGYSLASYKGTTGPSHLYIIQSENEADGEELQKMLAQMAAGDIDWEARMIVIENRPVTIRGQEAILVISEGVNHENVTYRQATVAFQGKSGPAMLVFSETLDLWDEEALDTFLQSIQ